MKPNDLSAHERNALYAIDQNAPLQDFGPMSRDASNAASRMSWFVALYIGSLSAFGLLMKGVHGLLGLL
jgi:hypothetical protein